MMKPWILVVLLFFIPIYSTPAVEKKTDIINSQFNDITACTSNLTVSHFPHSLMAPHLTDAEGSFEIASGKIPADLTGSVLITGTAPVQDHNRQNLHFFNGTPELRTLTFADGGAQFARKALVTPGTLLRSEVTSRGRKWSQYINRGVLSLSPVYGPEVTPSTALFQSHEGKVIVAVDSGRPWVLDVKQGRLIAPIGSADHLRPVVDLPLGLGIPHTFIEAHLMSAHPSYDPATQELFTTNFSLAVPGVSRFSKKPQTSLVISQDGENWKSLAILNPDGSPALIHQSVHQVNVSKHFVVIADTSFKVDLPSLIRNELFSTQAPYVKLFIVPRASIRNAFKNGIPNVTAQAITLPYEFGHYFINYDDRDGSEIELVMTTNKTVDLAHTILPDDRLVRDHSIVHPSYVGLPSGALDRSEVRKIRIQITGAPFANSVRVVEDQGVSSEATWGITVSTGPWEGSGIVPSLKQSLYAVSMGQTSDTIVERIASRYMNRTHRTWNDIAKDRPASLIRVKLDHLAIADTFLFDKGQIPTSPQFAPRSTKPDDGYIIVSVLSQSGDQIWIFDAKNLSQGPVTRLKHAHWKSGFTLHTLYLPATDPVHETDSDPVHTRKILEAYREEMLKARAELPFLEQGWFRSHVWPQVVKFFHDRGIAIPNE